MYIARAWYGLVKFWITISAVPLRCTVRCTVIRYGTEIRRTAVFIRFWTVYTVKYGTAYGTVQTLEASVKEFKFKKVCFSSANG